MIRQPVMVEVTLLSRADCSLCEFAAAVLARVGRDHPLTVRKLDLDSDAGRALAARHPVPFAPGVLLDGQLFGYGRLSERRLRRYLTRRYGNPNDDVSGRDR